MRIWTVGGFIIVIALIGLVAQSHPPDDLIRARTWALVWETTLAAVVSLGVTTGLFWVLEHVRSIQQIVLPGRDEAALAERRVTESLSGEGTQDTAAAMLFLGLALRGSARILAMTSIYAVTLWTFAPLS